MSTLLVLLVWPLSFWRPARFRSLVYLYAFVAPVVEFFRHFPLHISIFDRKTPSPRFSIFPRSNLFQYRQSLNSKCHGSTITAVLVPYVCRH